MAEKQELFWADQLARKIISRDRYRYLDKPAGKFSEYAVKTSASISGVLHIGRLSDTVRGASVYHALNDAGAKAKLIWVAEDMDPLRKIPEGVPASYAQYIGVPVSLIPDPEGCHGSYAEHHTGEYFKVLHAFAPPEMEMHSMQDEYHQGHFAPFIKKLIAHLDTVLEVQNKYRDNPLRKGWSPWTPICGGCSKIITPQVEFTDGGKVSYVCCDYTFETTTAKGCGHEGEADPLKDAGKLVWKSEWAAQWANWKVVSEGAGKEYRVPNSAFWINAEIAERVLDFPSPEPIFYEHIMIDGQKMSASLGNVIYPRDWLDVAPAGLLGFYYNKRLMMTRSFSWTELPQLYDEYDEALRLYHGEAQLENEKTAQHIKRLLEVAGVFRSKPLKMSFSHAAMIAQIFNDKAKIIASLQKTGQYEPDKEAELFSRIAHARTWLGKYAPDDEKFVVQDSVPAHLKLSAKQKKALHTAAEKLKEKEWGQKELFNEFYAICKELDMPAKEFFKAGYNVLLNRDRGPKLAPFVLALGDKAVALFTQA